MGGVDFLILVVYFTSYKDLYSNNNFIFNALVDPIGRLEFLVTPLKSLKNML